MASPKISAVICSWNKRRDLGKALDSLLESKDVDLTVIVSDNASTDGSPEMVLEDYHALPAALAEGAPDRMKVTSPEGIVPVVLVQNPENRGGSGGFNAGLRYALKATDAPYLFLMDDDAEVDERALRALSDFLGDHKDVGMACCKVDNRENPDIIQQYGTDVSFDDYCVHSPYAGHPEDGTVPPFVYCDAVPACALLVRREVVETIGLLPEENFLYWDDTDWCTRCRQAGYRIACVGSAIALHRMGAKKEAVTTFPVYYSWRNRLVYFLTYTPEEKRPDMVHKLLADLFADLYTAYYNEEPALMRTLAAAFDDALHGRMGKAGDGIIGPVTGEKTRDRKEKIGGREVLQTDSVLLLRDFSGQKVYMDPDGNICAGDDDILKVMSYPVARDLWLKTGEELLLRKLRSLSPSR